MRAVVYKKPFQVAVKHVPDPGIEHSNDALIRITSACICGSDLHVYEGRTAAEPGIILGHENLGVIEEIGPGVVSLAVGDRVVMPASVACGHCRNCRAGFTALCRTAGPGWTAAGPAGGSRRAGGGHRCAAICPGPGGQAEYLRVPYADLNCLRLPPGTDHEADYVLLADAFPAGYHGCELAGVSPGESVAVYGAGPVGLMAAYSATLRGAARVFVVDRVPERLARAAAIGAVPVDFTAGDPAQQIKDQTGGDGADKGVDAVGYRAAGYSGDGEDPAAVLNSLIEAVRPAGLIGVPGRYVTADPGAPDEAARQGRLLLAVGRLFEKGQGLLTAHADVQRYDRQLRDLITAGLAAPGFVVSHELSLGQAPAAYAMFAQRAAGCTKVILHP